MYNTAPHVRLVCSATSAAEFEKFLALRGDKLEQARWGALLCHGERCRQAEEAVADQRHQNELSKACTSQHGMSNTATRCAEVLPSVPAVPVPAAHTQWLAAEAEAEASAGGKGVLSWRLQRLTIMEDVPLPTVLADLIVRLFLLSLARF